MRFLVAGRITVGRLIRRKNTGPLSWFLCPLASCLFIITFEGVGKSTLAAVVAVEVFGHEDSGTTVGAFTTETGDLAIIVDLVATENGHLDSCLLLLDLLRLGVVLLLAFLASSTKSQNEVQGGFLLDVVVAEGTAIFELLASEDQALLIGGNAFLVLDLGLYIFDGIGGLDIKGDGLAREGLHEDLHDC